MAWLSDDRLLVLYYTVWPVAVLLAADEDTVAARVRIARAIVEAPSLAAAVEAAKADRSPSVVDRVRLLRQKAGVESYYRKKPVVIAAKQWQKLGDHPAVEVWTLHTDNLHDCKHCARAPAEHGWIKTLEGGHIVCPGDYIIEGVRGEMYPCKADIFEETYEAVDLEQGGR